jgi:hypothetical protein
MNVCELTDASLSLPVCPTLSVSVSVSVSAAGDGVSVAAAAKKKSSSRSKASTTRPRKSSSVSSSSNGRNNRPVSMLFTGTRFADDNAFTIRHYAGRVTYNVNGFVKKNTNATQPDLEAVLAQGDGPAQSFVREMLEARDRSSAAASASAASRSKAAAADGAGGGRR